MQCLHSECGWPASMLVTRWRFITTTAKSHGINIAIKIKIIWKLQFLFNWMFRYIHIVLKDLIIITSLVSIKLIVMELRILHEWITTLHHTWCAQCCIGTCAACMHNKNNYYFTYYLFSNIDTIKKCIG